MHRLHFQRTGTALVDPRPVQVSPDQPLSPPPSLTGKLTDPESSEWTSQNRYAEHFEIDDSMITPFRYRASRNKICRIIGEPVNGPEDISGQVTIR
jgi:hypothetical protein